MQNVDRWGSQVLLKDGYALQVRCSPRGAFRALHHVADHAAECGCRPHFRGGGGYAGRPLTTMQPDTCATCRELVDIFAAPSVGNHSPIVFATPIVFVVRLRHLTTALAYDIVSVSTLIPQGMYNTASLALAIDMRKAVHYATTPAATPCSSIQFVNWTQQLCAEHVQLWEMISRRVTQEVAHKTKPGRPSRPPSNELRTRAVCPPGPRARTTSPRRVHTFPKRPPEYGSVYLYEMAAQFISGTPLPEEVSHTRHTVDPVGSTSTPGHRFLVEAASVASPTASPEKATNDGALAAHVALCAARDLAGSLTLTSVVALMVSSVAQDALPCSLSEPLGYPLIMAAAMRLATRPVLFGVRDTRTPQEQLAAAEFNELVEHSWHPYQSNTRVQGSSNGTRVAPTPLLLDSLFASAIAGTGRLVSDPQLGGVLPSNRPISLLVVKRMQQWQTAALETLTHLFGSAATVHACTGSTDASDPLMAGRTAAYRRVGLTGTEDEHNECPLRAALGEAWPVSAMSKTQMRDRVVALVLDAEEALRHANECDSPPREDASDGGTRSSDRPTNVLFNTMERLARDGTRPGDVRVRRAATTIAMGSISTDPFEPYLITGQHRGAPDADDVSTGPCGLLTQALAYGGSETYDAVRLDFAVHAPGIHGTCFRCSAKTPSIQTLIPVPHSTCSRCKAQMCFSCGTVAKEEHQEAVVCDACTACVRVHQDPESPL